MKRVERGKRVDERLYFEEEVTKLELDLEREKGR